MMLLRRVLQRLVGDYALYKIYRTGCGAPRNEASYRLAPINDPAAFGRATDSEIAALRDYGGDGAHGFGAWIDDDLAAVCWYWVGDRDRQSSTWPTTRGEAKLAQITTAKRYRGRGLAAALIAYSAGEMQSRGFHTLYARVWHSNRASSAAFRKAGWAYIAFVVEVFPLGCPLRLVFRSRRQK